MKKLGMMCVACIMATTLWAQSLEEITLNAPEKTRGSTFMKTLSDRRSERGFSTKELNLQDLSDLLWAANGVNRSDGKRTAPSAMNRQEIDIYVFLRQGAYLYDAARHTLKPVAPGDHRSAIAGSQDFVRAAPVSLLLVIDLEKLGDAKAEQTRLMGAVDAGIVSQNINLFCAAVGLATVPRASMAHAELTKILNLRDTQIPIMNNPVGYLGKL